VPAFNIARPGLGGFVDSVQADPSGIIRIVGWCRSEFDMKQVPSVSLDGHPVPFLQCFRFRRPDVPLNLNGVPSQTGLALDYLVPESMIGQSKVLAIDLGKQSNFRFEAEFDFIDPHYRGLLNTREVLHREHIYGSGPPNATVDPEIFELAKQLKGPLLDFGCGGGALIRELRRLGIEAYGLELNSGIVPEFILPESAAAITFYDGSFPSPFEDGRFRSVLCSEVLEHITDYQAAIRDIARLATKEVIFTVPDASAIPLGFRHFSVPWHLLEGTHVNFFTQESLKHALQPYFKKIEFGRVDLCRLNDTEFYVGLTASCSK
jgi:ubiquinone/menaquinone biosynthesis C-methylase UbiE